MITRSTARQVRIRLADPWEIDAVNGESILTVCNRSRVLRHTPCQTVTWRGCTMLLREPNDRTWCEVLSCKKLVLVGLQVRKITQDVQLRRTANKTAVTNNEITQKNRNTRTLDDMILDGERYSKSSGVELKVDPEEEGINWERIISWKDCDEIVKRYANLFVQQLPDNRCMMKYPSVVPGEKKVKDILTLIEKLPSFEQGSSPDLSHVGKIRGMWIEAYTDNLEKVMFDNLSSYEP